jgi:hypothetical protein
MIIIISNPLFYNIYSKIYNQNELNSHIHKIIYKNLFINQETQLSDFLKNDEITHLKEVRRLNLFFLFLTLLTILFLYIKKVKLKSLFKYDRKEIFVITSIIFLILISWDNFFILFHKLLFKTKWQFTSNSQLIKLYYTNNSNYFLFLAIFSILIYILLTLSIYLKIFKNQKRR